MLLEVLPSSYGVRLEEDEFSVILSKNTTIPTKCSKVFTTSLPNQSSIRLDIFQGENRKASKNTFLHTMELTNIPPAEAGVPQIEVTFDVDANMIVHVSARHLATGSEQNVAVRSPFGLNKAQKELMINRMASWRAEQESPSST
jgi:molecular chaperone DnaK